MKKITVGILFGGKSTEHEVSLQSAKNIIDALDKDKYNIILIGIDKTGRWFFVNDSSHFLLNSNNPKYIALNKTNKKIAFIPGAEDNQLLCVSDISLCKIDVVFPILHGTYGEDGTIQGLLKLANLPFVGAGVLGSAISMDKDVTKRLLRDAGILIARFAVVHRWERKYFNFKSVLQDLGLPVFVKPANAGSSVGVSKVQNESDLVIALNKAFEFDNKVLIEEFIQGRELECSVLGNEAPVASGVGEIISQKDFYSYEAKYIDENGAYLEIPANIPEKIVQSIQELAIKTYKVLSCEGMARVDFFLSKDNTIIVNEVNTIPGFTNISMYPKLWEISGLPYSSLIDRLIQLALDRKVRDMHLKTSYE